MTITLSFTKKHKSLIFITRKGRNWSQTCGRDRDRDREMNDADTDRLKTHILTNDVIADSESYFFFFFLDDRFSTDAKVWTIPYLGGTQSVFCPDLVVAPKGWP